MNRLVDVYPYRSNRSQFEFLILKRASDVIYAGQWRMIGGKVNSNETYHEAARRELKEEIGGTSNLFWTIPSINQFYDHENDQLHQIPAFAARIATGQGIILNHEHQDYRWISTDVIRDFIAWPEQRRLMQLTHSIVTNNEILEEWIINGSK
ncbi:MAG: NUDIX domain-containing protein [Fodinibius sp.]|nr:NUDIX domain-containing protein [Fodinibius sp.]